MATLTINGQKVTVDDGFLSLTPEQQEATVEEIAGSLGAATAPQSQAPEAGSYGDGYFAQATSGLNEGLANTVGATVDMMNNFIVAPASAGINSAFGTDIKPSDKPFLGSEFFKEPMRRVGSIQPETSDPSKKAVRRISQELGGAVIPSLSLAGKANGVSQGAKAMAAALGSGAGAATANTVAPDNPYAELAGQLLGGMSVAGPMALASRARSNRAIRQSIPNGDELRAAKDAAYKQVDDMGVKYTPEALASLRQGIKDDLSAAQLDDILNPKATRASQILDQRLQQPQTLSELDRARQFVRNNVVDVPGQKIEGRFADRMITNIDEFVGSATPSQAASGDPSSANVAINNARKLNTQVRKYDQISDALGVATHKAGSTYSGGNIDNASRQAIRAILDNPKKVRGFTMAEREMMEKIVMGTPWQNRARQVGKLSPSGNGLQQSLALGATAYNPLMAAAPATGMVAKHFADRETSKNVQGLLEMIANSGKVKKSPLLTKEYQGILGALMAAQATSALQNAN